MSPDSGIFKHPAPSHTRIRLNADGTTTQLGESDPSPPNTFLERAELITRDTRMVDIPRITRENYSMTSTAVKTLRQQMDDILEADPERYARLDIYRRQLTNKLLRFR